MFRAHVRMNRVTDTRYLRNQSRHARRIDKASNVRPDATPGTAILWRPQHAASDYDSLDYGANHRTLLETEGASVRCGAAIACHLLIGISPDWVRETGDLHNPENPRNIALLSAAVDWVRSWAGENAIFGARLDLDEAGGGIVDVFCAPIREHHHRSGTHRRFVSVRGALRELQITTGEKTREFSALQTGWAAAAACLDPRIMRGERIVGTGRPHLSTARSNPKNRRSRHARRS